MAENNTVDLPSVLNLASQRMGIERLKPKQLEAVEAFVSRKDTFVSLPTGYGKSIIFAILPLLFNLLLGNTLHVSCVDIIRIFFVLFLLRNPGKHCCSIDIFDDGPKREIFTARFGSRICW